MSPRKLRLVYRELSLSKLWLFTRYFQEVLGKFGWEVNGTRQFRPVPAEHFREQRNI